MRDGVAGVGALGGVGLVAAPGPAQVEGVLVGSGRIRGRGGVVRWRPGGWSPRSARQPWIVFGVLRTADAVNPAPGLIYGFLLVAAVYLVLTAATVYVLRRMVRDRPVPVAPQERDVTHYKIV